MREPAAVSKPNLTLPACHNNKAMKLLKPSPCARNVLGITKLTAVFDIFDDEADALLNLANVPLFPRN